MNQSNESDAQDIRWLVLDKNLKTVKKGSHGVRTQFNKGFIVNSVPEEGEEGISYCINIDEILLDKKKPSITSNYHLCSGQAIRLSDGLTSKRYDRIHEISANFFYVRQGDSVGIVSFDGEVLLPLKYYALTYPVSGYAFGFRHIDNSNSSVDFLQIEKDSISVRNVIQSRSMQEIASELHEGLYKITVSLKDKGYKAVMVKFRHVFDEKFSHEIGKLPGSPSLSFYEGGYWFSDDASLIVKNEVIHKDEQIERDDRLDTWEAMTDGMYGDYPEGFDDDYSFLGQ